MIIVEISQKAKIGKIKMSGHAEYSVSGQDIVCAAASFLGQTVNNQLFMFNNKVKTKIINEPSLLEISNIELVGESKTIFEYFTYAIEQLALSYPEYVKVKK